MIKINKPEGAVNVSIPIPYIHWHRPQHFHSICKQAPIMFFLFAKKEGNLGLFYNTL